MPRLPIIDQRSTIGNVRATPESFGGGRGIVDLGEAVGQYQDKVRKHKERKERDWQTVTMARIRSWGAETLKTQADSAEDGAPNFQSNIDALFDKERERIVSAAPESVKQDTAARLEVYREELKTRAMSFESQAAARLAISNGEQIIDTARNTLINDPHQLPETLSEALEYFDNQPRIPADKRRDLKNYTKQKLAKSALQGMDADEALDVLNSGDYDRYLDPDDKASLIGAKQRELASEQAEQKKSLQAMRAGRLSNLDIAVSRGIASYSEVEDAYDNGKGWLKPAERTRLIKQLDKQLSESQKEADQISLVAAAEEFGIPLDPRSKGGEHRKALDAHYTALSETWQGLEPEDALDRAVDYSIKFGMVPSPVQSLIRGSIRAGTPEQKVIAADMLERMRNENRQLLNDFDNQDIQIGNLIATYSTYGVSPGEAVRLVNESMAVPESAKEARDSEFFDYVKDNPSQEWLADELDPGLFGFEPEIPGAMEEEFNQLAQMQYKMHGNMDAARQTALDLSLRIWGESKFNGGKSMMRFSPEKFYGVSNMSLDQNSEWMRDQLIQEIRETSFVQEGFEDRLFINPMPGESDERGMPVYQVNLIGEDGIIRPMRRETGEIMPWQPNWETSEAFDRMKQEQDESVKKAKEGRASAVFGD